MQFTYKSQNIFAFSDTHGMHRKLPIPSDANILICAGDVLPNFSVDGLGDFFDWFVACPAKLRIFVPGNHEIVFDFYPQKTKQLIPEGIVILEDKVFEYEDITFYSITDKASQHYAVLGQEIDMPKNVDILITHQPPEGFLDNGCGDSVFRNIVLQKRPKNHLFGHIHAEGEKSEIGTWTEFYNVSQFDQLKKAYHVSV
ncbi:metallophosphoesterase [Bacteroides sp. OttesenSCG-928-F21]|nr:metallophosphoesterase [Bacteroides sp. OttesenSCG-928-F21]